MTDAQVVTAVTDRLGQAMAAFLMDGQLLASSGRFGSRWDSAEPVVESLRAAHTAALMVDAPDDPLFVRSWMAAPNAALDGVTPAQAIRERRINAVLDAAMDPAMERGAA
ncbi:antitoxin Xre/MbcA/ParS toxin-binding domain-containing protein [Gordonia zhaorongruii]|uniref:antitoxin Xre/MbcA/ParS toxin-binding domain-containing protein n=1 Tax=Gordonia zhaorongruii TaxID=2597659 RepID=UPI001405502C|nr:antitoxin Xre/MbcA/ParS toxin-binding domain-containing protein [Gordonia zhaorongruii]